MSHKELRDGAHVKAKFTLPKTQASLVISSAKKEEDFVAAVIVELYGCVGWVRHGDTHHIVCASGKSLSCPTWDGRLRIKAQGPAHWSNPEDITVLANAVKSGLAEAASGGANRVRVLMKFSLHYDLRNARGETSLAYAAALIFSNVCTAGIEEVNICFTPFYRPEDCTVFVSRCQELVLLGKLLPHTTALPSDESVLSSMQTKNRSLQDEVNALRRQIEVLERQNSKNNNLQQNEVDTLKKALEEQKSLNDGLQDEVSTWAKQTKALNEQAATTKKLHDDALNEQAAMNKKLRHDMDAQREAIEWQKSSNKNLQDEVDALKEDLEKQASINTDLHSEVSALTKQTEALKSAASMNKKLQDEVVALKKDLEKQRSLNRDLHDESSALMEQTNALNRRASMNQKLHDEMDSQMKQMEALMEWQKSTNKNLQEELSALRKQMEAVEEEKRLQSNEFTGAQNTRPLSHHQRRRKKKQTEQFPRTPDFTD